MARDLLRLLFFVVICRWNTGPSSSAMYRCLSCDTSRTTSIPYSSTALFLPIPLFTLGLKGSIDSPLLELEEFCLRDALL